MKVSSYLFVFFVIVLFLCPIVTFSSEIPKIGVRGGLGTDINLGLAFGVGGNYLLDMGENPLELGVLLFYSHWSETSYEGIYDYEYNESSDVIVFGMMANYLFGYKLGMPGMFLLAGFGLGMMNVEWEEWSPDDESLGEYLPDGGSRQDASGTGAGSVFNLGGGMAFSNGADVRFEIPVILVFGEYGEASTVIPTFTITAGMRF